MEERNTPFPRSRKEYPSGPINKQASGFSLDKQLPGHSGPSQIDILRQAISQVEMLQEKKRSCEQMISTAEGNFRTITNSSRMSTKSIQKAFSSGIEYNKGNLDELAALLQGPTTLLDQFQNISKEHSRKKGQLNQKTEQLRKQFENLAKTTNNPKDFGTIEAELEKLQQQKNKLDTQREAVQEGIAKHSFEAQDEILKEICAKRIRNSYRMAHRVDLCFMFDGTGSMTQWIGLTRETIDRIIASVRQAYPDISFSFAVIVYRDVKTLRPDKTGYFDGSPFEILPFTDNISSVTRFLEGIRTYRNCDSAEDMNLGFQKTLKDLEWTSPTKILIHIADSPCHGSQFGSSNDNYPDGLPTDKPWVEIFRELKTLAIDYYFLAIRKTKTAQMFEEFKKIWEKSGVYAGGEKKKSVIASEDIHELNADDFVKKITASLLDSVKRTLSYLSSVSSMGLFSPEINTNFDAVIHDDEENKKDDLEDINWNLSSNWKKVKGNIISVNEITIEKLLAGKWKTAKSNYTLSIRNKPFAKGAFSIAYPAKLEKLDCQLVAKKPLAGDIELDKAHQDQELEKNAIALSVVQAFNQDIKSCRGLQWCLVDYLPTFIFNGNNCTYMVEGYLGCDFTKYSNNLDAVSETQDIRHLTALAHYCFMKTNEQYLITDFQGSQKRLLTDPVIHSRTQKFHKTGDLGYEGIITFFSRHKCNAVCQALRLQMPKSIQKIKDLPVWKDKIDLPDSMPEKKEKCKSKLCTSLIENPKYVFCKACHNLMRESTIQKKCQDCPNNFETSSYFYVFMGLKQTRRCKTCRDKRKK